MWRRGRRCKGGRAEMKGRGGKVDKGRREKRPGNAVSTLKAMVSSMWSHDSQGQPLAFPSHCSLHPSQ